MRPVVWANRCFHVLRKVIWFQQKAYILYATAFKALVNWPQGFHDFLDAYKLRDGQVPNGQLRHDLGRIYFPWLQKMWQHPAFSFMLEAFDHYLSMG